MESIIFRLGKEAGRAIGRSTTIKLNLPGSKKRLRDATHGKGSNASPPWRSGRKPAVRKK